MKHRWHAYFCLTLLLALVSVKGFTADAIAEHDPTQPAIAVDVIASDTKKAPEPTYVLQSIILSPTRQLALINAHFVKVGDRIDSATVEAIDKNAVVLSWPGRKLTLYLIEHRGWK